MFSVYYRFSAYSLLATMQWKIFAIYFVAHVALCWAGGEPTQNPGGHTLYCQSTGNVLSGPPGPPGPQGADGSCAQNCPKNPVYKSCLDIKTKMSSATNGMYTITDDQGSKYRTYCDMSIAGGGWTLVASVHEDYMGGKCTNGDRWSSEHGNNANHANGDGAWENTKTFGSAESATSDDYKNPGYFNINAKNVMIWHVPNNALLQEYSSKAFMQYHTTTNFLTTYGGNLYKLFRDHYQLRDNAFDKNNGNGPAPAVTWDRGNNAMMVDNSAPNVRVETLAGFIQFRAINNEKEPFAICPGVKIKASYGNVEHACIGGTGYHRETARHCGDFAGKDFNGYATGTGWSSNQKMTESVVAAGNGVNSTRYTRSFSALQ